MSKLLFFLYATVFEFLYETILFSREEREKAMLQLLRRSGMMSKSIRHSTSSASNLIIITELPGNVIHIELNRPEKLNSLHYEMFQAIAETDRKSVV